MTNRKSTWAFQRAIDGVRMLPLSPPRGGSKPSFHFCGIKFNFNQITSTTKFRCVKTSSHKVVEQSISYEFTEKHRTEHVSFHLKYWLKLTYPVVAPCDDLGHRSAAEWRHVWNTVHSELTGFRHSALQSHSLFVLTKHLSTFWVSCVAKCAHYMLCSSMYFTITTLQIEIYNFEFWNKSCIIAVEYADTLHFGAVYKGNMHIFACFIGCTIVVKCAFKFSVDRCVTLLLLFTVLNVVNQIYHYALHLCWYSKLMTSHQNTGLKWVEEVQASIVVYPMISI